MARKNVVNAFSMITDGDMSAEIISSVTDVKNLDNAAIRLTWDIGGTPVGTVTVEAVQTKESEPEADYEWFELDFGSTITIDNTGTEHQLIFNQLTFDKIRLKYNRTSGTGTMNAKITAKTVGA